MTEEQIKKIIEQLADHEKRLTKLENYKTDVLAVNIKPVAGKQQTLRELIKGRIFKNGQEQIAVIVGFHEKILGQLINKDNLKPEWENAKMTNKYNTAFVDRAKDTFIRISKEGKCDLTQTGELFFDSMANGKN